MNDHISASLIVCFTEEQHRYLRLLEIPGGPVKMAAALSVVGREGRKYVGMG